MDVDVSALDGVVFAAAGFFGSWNRRDGSISDREVVQIHGRQTFALPLLASFGPNNSVNTLSAAFLTSRGGAHRSLVAVLAAVMTP